MNVSIHPPLVFIVILQYNNSQDTLECLESLKELYPVKSPDGGTAEQLFDRVNYPNHKVVVVDNASQEAEVNNIKEYARSQVGVELLENKENLGYAGGNNVGIKYALENGADYVFVLNNDTKVEKDALRKLVAAAEADAEIGIVGPAIKEGEKTAYFGKISWLKPELKHSYHPPLSTRFHLVLGEYVPGAAMLIKKELLEKIEGFDEIYFLYFEDADFSIRAQLAGYKLKVVPEAVINHKVSASTKHLGSPLILRYHMRNSLTFNSLNAPWTVKPFLIFWAGYIVLKNLVKMFVMPAKAQAADAIIEGVLDFYKNKFGAIVPK
ncbi:MAG: glycosyltransferase family 2 protein [Candidatus Yanofskybacteria bacterium]|nr:glycosyltransferase family 2 protein [Candidatus Yanofskybacteria bacterium]